MTLTPRGASDVPDTIDAADLYAKNRVVSADVFDDLERRAISLSGRFGSTVTALQDTALSDSNGLAVLLTMDEFLALTPRGASDVLPTIDAFEKALSDYADAITNWSACTGGFVDAAEMRRHILESGALVMSMFTALTTRSAALEAEKAELREKLAKYGDHQVGCGARLYGPAWHGCECGFREIFAVVVASPPSPAERTE